MDNIYKESI